MKTPLIDLSRQHEAIKDEITEKVATAVANGAFVGGPEVEGFEREFADYLGASEVVGVSNGTAALHLSLRALELGPTDEVVLPANTFIATAEAVAIAGAKPVLCDVDEATGLANAATMARAITERTRVLIPVHLWGNVVDMAPIRELAASNGLTVIEDAAQAHGARYLPDGGARAGSLGHAAGFSFYPAKNLGAIGEGGACAVGDPELADRIRQLRDHGQAEKHVHRYVGDNGRLPAIQAAALRIKLERLDGWNARRREIATAYADALGEIGVRCVTPPEWSESVHHQFVIRVERRDEWVKALAERGVATAIHYPTPVHLQPAFAGLGYEVGSVEVAERLSAEVLSLPMFPELRVEEVSHVIGSVKDVAERLQQVSIGS